MQLGSYAVCESKLKPLKDLSVLLKFYPLLIHIEPGTAAKYFFPMACHSAGQKLHIAQCSSGTASAVTHVIHETEVTEV